MRFVRDKRTGRAWIWFSASDAPPPAQRLSAFPSGRQEAARPLGGRRGRSLASRLRDDVTRSRRPSDEQNARPFVACRYVLVARGPHSAFSRTICVRSFNVSPWCPFRSGRPGVRGDARGERTQPAAVSVSRSEGAGRRAQGQKAGPCSSALRRPTARTEDTGARPGTESGNRRKTSHPAPGSPGRQSWRGAGGAGSRVPAERPGAWGADVEQEDLSVPCGVRGAGFRERRTPTVPCTPIRFQLGFFPQPTSQPRP